MARVTVTIPPEMFSISGFLLEKAISNFLSFPSYDGELIVGFDKKDFPVRIGPKPPRVFFDPWILISEDLNYLFASEDSIFADSITISGVIKADGTGDIFPLGPSNTPLINLSFDSNNWPDSLSSSSLVNINKTSRVALFDINVPRRARVSYFFSDLTTTTISNQLSYYSIDFGNTWNANSGPFITSPDFGYGRVLIYIDISNENIRSDDAIFLLQIDISDDIIYLTAEYGEIPTSSSKGTILGKDLIEINNFLSTVRGKQPGPISYGTFKRCLNTNGLAEFYGESRVSIVNGVISYSYDTFQSFSNGCIK